MPVIFRSVFPQRVSELREDGSSGAHQPRLVVPGWDAKVQSHHSSNLYSGRCPMKWVLPVPLYSGTAWCQTCGESLRSGQSPCRNCKAAADVQMCTRSIPWIWAESSSTVAIGLSYEIPPRTSADGRPQDELRGHPGGGIHGVLPRGHACVPLLGAESEQCEKSPY